MSGTRKAMVGCLDSGDCRASPGGGLSCINRRRTAPLHRCTVHCRIDLYGIKARLRRAASCGRRCAPSSAAPGRRSPRAAAVIGLAAELRESCSSGPPLSDNGAIRKMRTTPSRIDRPNEDRGPHMTQGSSEGGRMSTTPGTDGPRSTRGVPIGSPSSRDVYSFFLLPGFVLGFAIWIAFMLVTGHPVTAQVLTCSGKNCQVTWVENGHPRYASVDRSRGAHPGSQIAIQAGSVGGTVSVSASRFVLAGMLILTVVSTPLMFPLISATRRARTKAWTEWDRSHPTVYE